MEATRKKYFEALLQMKRNFISIDFLLQTSRIKFLRNTLAEVNRVWKMVNGWSDREVISVAVVIRRRRQNHSLSHHPSR